MEPVLYFNLKKLNMKLPFVVPEIYLLCTDSEELKEVLQKFCKLAFIASLFTVAKR